MRPKQTITALIVAVLLLMSAGIIGAFVFSSPTIVGSGVDHFNGLENGDNYTVSVTSNATESTATYTTRGVYFAWLYESGGLCDPNHHKDITVNGVTVTCDCYYLATDDGKIVYFVDPNAEPDHARTYGYEEYVGKELVDSRYLVSTNFSLNRPIGEQVMYEGEKMSYITDDTVTSKICPAVSLIMSCTVTQTVGRYDESQVKWAVSIDTESHDTGYATTTVAKYYPDEGNEKVITTDGKTMTKDEYLMTVDYEAFLSYIKSTGATMSRGVPVEKTINTVYGEREVTEEVLTIFGSFDARYTVDFGSDYVIYSITEEKNSQEGTVVTSVTSCSFMYEGTKEVYGAQITFTANSIGVALVFIAVGAVAAIVIGRLVFNAIYHKTEKT